MANEKAFQSNSSKKLPLPIGISNYKEVNTDFYLVDKTLIIKDLLDERAKVTFFTRPRRFGKTLNMSMLKTFFEKTDKDTSVYFKDKKIWSTGAEYTEQQGKYPVIFLTFKDVKSDNWAQTLEFLTGLIGDEFARHKELLTSESCDERSKKFFRAVYDDEASETDLARSLNVLSKMLYEQHGIKPIILVDEYDTPIQHGYVKGFYDKIITFMRNFFSGGLKDNEYLYLGVLTGILRVSKESIFSGLNNLKVNTVLDKKYSEYFGFTHDEVKAMTKYYEAEDKYNEICE